MSIVIRQTPEAHEKTAKLFSALPKEHDLLIIANARIIQWPKGKSGEWLDQAAKVNTSADGLRWALSIKSGIRELLDYVMKGVGRVLSSPGITTLPGHAEEISVSGGEDEGQPSGWTLSLTARPLSECVLLRLCYQVGVDESRTTGGRGIGLLKSGQTPVFEYISGQGSQAGVPMVRKVPYVTKLFGNTPGGKDVHLIAITPRLVRTDVQAAPLDRIDAAYEVGRDGRVTPPVAADR
ncbi:MAG: type II and III secretion system protein [Fuerstiella sp.]|nr:type II and III secretion system protein [Fuerstiella sp.]